MFDHLSVCVLPSSTPLCCPSLSFLGREFATSPSATTTPQINYIFRKKNCRNLEHQHPPLPLLKRNEILTGVMSSLSQANSLNKAGTKGSEIGANESSELSDITWISLGGLNLNSGCDRNETMRFKLSGTEGKAPGGGRTRRLFYPAFLKS